jgi:hypothetical protein
LVAGDQPLARDPVKPESRARPLSALIAKRVWLKLMRISRRRRVLKAARTVAALQARLERWPLDEGPELVLRNSSNIQKNIDA